MRTSGASSPSRWRPKPKVRLITGLRLRALAWLCLLGPSFFLLYGYANSVSLGKEGVPSIVFDWERHIPFVPQFMLPYMSEDLFYGLSLFIAASRRELDRHAQRLLLCTVLSVSCFLLYPLQFSFERPPVAGLNGWLLDVLMGFDKPYNQAPSLHISLLVLLWVQFAKHVQGWAWRALQVWFVAIGLSVLLVWQHHFIDVILGLFAGFTVLYILPDAEDATTSQRTGHPRPAVAYGLVSLLLAGAGICLKGAAWWLLWPAAAAGVVAVGYAGMGVTVFQKRCDGRHSAAVRVLLAPYLLVAGWAQAKLAQRHPVADVYIDTLCINPWPGTALLPTLDLCAELPRGAGDDMPYAHVPMLDLVVPDASQLDAAMDALERLGAASSAVQVHCALGLGRSAVVAAAWLLHRGRAGSVEDALSMLKTAHPTAVLPRRASEVLSKWRAAHG